MVYFVVFNKKGVVEYQEGTAPPFLNTLIRSLDLKQISGSKNVQDLLAEYRVDEQWVFLSLSDRPVLDGLIQKYKKTENEEKDTKAVSRPGTELDFSERSNRVASITTSIKKAEFKKAFGLFTGKIDIQQLQKKMIEHLVKKNVEPSLCRAITEGVIGDLKSMNVSIVSEAVFKEKIGNTLEKIFLSFDHAGFIEKIKNSSGAFSICFVGVNGVGKSTTLPKIACWLLQQGLRVYIAACDTFRAGAIEQLKVHVERFRESGYDVGFFESGYAKDDAAVAKYAIAKANREHFDVVLIDTAGRMHNKEGLMASLSKLIRVNVPDHIVFVGEALVGSDSLEHIGEFNRRVAEGSPGRKIDSIVLTKIDTVEDKIGQVINFPFKINSPIMFLGAGQSNSDLVRVDMPTIINLLLS